MARRAERSFVAASAPASEGEPGDGGPAEGADLAEPVDPPGAAAGAPLAERPLLARARDAKTAQAGLAAVLAWSMTVAPAAFARGLASPRLAGALAVVAIGCGVGGPLLAARDKRLGRHLGVTVFLSLSVMTWLVAAQAIAPARLDPTRGALGALAWGIFALAWSDRWQRPGAGAVDPSAPALVARAALPPLAVPIAAAGALAGVVLLVLAWRVRDPERAVVAQALTALCAVAVMSAAASVAIGRGKRATGSRRLGVHATRPLLILAAFAVAGAAVIALR
jgi:hypothetical protein